MKIRVIENVMIEGKHVETGTVIDVSKEDAGYLKAIKRAIDPDEDYTAPVKDEYLSLVEEMTDKALTASAKEFDVDIKNLSREEANKSVAEAMKEAEKK